MRLGLAGLRSDQGAHRIARRQLDEREDAEGDEEKKRHRDAQAPQDEGA